MPFGAQIQNFGPQFRMSVRNSEFRTEIQKFRSATPKFTILNLADSDSVTSPGDDDALRAFSPVLGDYRPLLIGLAMDPRYHHFRCVRPDQPVSLPKDITT